MKSKRILFFSYLIAIHVLLVIFAAKSIWGQRLRGVPDRHITAMAHQHNRMDPQVTDGFSVFLGDSITAGLVSSLVDPYSVNYGVNTLTTSRLIHNMKSYESLKRAKRVFLLIGINDISIKQHDGLNERLSSIMNSVPEGTPLVWSLISPTTDNDKNTKISMANEHIRKLCVSRPGCRVVDTWEVLGGLGNEAFTDGLHLSTRGYEAWSRALKKAADL